MVLKRIDAYGPAVRHDEAPGKYNHEVISSQPDLKQKPQQEAGA